MKNRKKNHLIFCCILIITGLLITTCDENKEYVWVFINNSSFQVDFYGINQCMEPSSISLNPGETKSSVSSGYPEINIKIDTSSLYTYSIKSSKTGGTITFRDNEDYLW